MAARELLQPFANRLVGGDVLTLKKKLFNCLEDFTLGAIDDESEVPAWDVSTKRTTYYLPIYLRYSERK